MSPRSARAAKVVHKDEAAAEAAASGEPLNEYASVTVTIDHLIRDGHPDGHVVVKDVWSTETAVESLLAQIDYFQDNAIIRRPGICSMIAKGEEKAAVFVYEVNEGQTNVIVDAALWDECLAREKTVLGAHASFITLAADMKRQASVQGLTERVLAFISE
jgi:hypothetical protein